MEAMLSSETFIHIHAKSVRLILGPEDRGDAFLRNFGSFTDYTALHPRRWKRSLLYLAYTKLVYTLLLLLAVVTYMIQYTHTTYWKRHIIRS
jgi:hypothetical protein